MHVSLTPELRRFVEAKIAGGGYADANAVISEGLCLLKRSDEIRSTHRARVARDWLDAGQSASIGAAAAAATPAPAGPVAKRS